MDTSKLIPVSKHDIRVKTIGNRKLLSSTLVPSASHSYALAIEYIKNWFLSKFQKDFFKTVYIEGKNIFDDTRKNNINMTARRQTPAVTIIPSIDFSFDRDKLDLPLGGLAVYEERSTVDSCFFRDPENKLYIKETDQLNLLNFTIRVYVDTRAKQLNLWHYMKLAFRVGVTQGEYVDIDYSIPTELMLQLAIDNNFEVDLENKKIINVIEFLNYLNQHSVLPILYKLRCENGKDEFFIRTSEQYVHIAIPDYLSVDDGDRVGHTYESFPIEMNLSLRFPAPQSFSYMSRNPQKLLDGVMMETSDNIVGLYSLRLIDVPKTNEKGWVIYIQTEYLEDEPVTESVIELKDLFDGQLLDVLNYTKKQFLSPALFIDIKVYDNEQNLLDSKMNWKDYTLSINHYDKYQKIIIVIYADNKYMNETIVTMNNYSESRLNRSDHQ